MGVIQREGTHGLLTLMNSDHPTSELTNALTLSVHNCWISGFFNFFTSICMFTAFLGVSLGLFDFLADGLKFNKSGIQGKFTLILTFIPPLAVVLINPGIYLQALSYAGIACVILLLLLPSIMAWRGRQLDTANHQMTQLPGGTISLCFVGIIAIGLLTIAS